MNIAYAQSQVPLITTAAGLQVVLCNIFNLIFWVLMAISVIMVLVAALTYVTAGGDSEKISKATKTITYAVIGIVIALIAKEVPTIIGSFFGKSLHACEIATSNIITNQ